MNKDKGQWEDMIACGQGSGGTYITSITEGGGLATCRHRAFIHLDVKLALHQPTDVGFSGT